jgi:hypothetical protein
VETITRSIADLAANERTVNEGLVGTSLSENQQIVVQVLDADPDVIGQRLRTAADYAILADLDDAEAALLIEAINQRSPGRDILL